MQNEEVTHIIKTGVVMDGVPAFAIHYMLTNLYSYIF